MGLQLRIFLQNIFCWAFPNSQCWTDHSHLPFSDSTCTLPGKGASPAFRHYFNYRSTLTHKFFLRSSWFLPLCSSHPRCLREDNCSSWHLIPQSALSFQKNCPILSSRAHGMNSSSFDRALGGLALENTDGQSLPPVFPDLACALQEEDPGKPHPISSSGSAG